MPPELRVPEQPGLRVPEPQAWVHRASAVPKGSVPVPEPPGLPSPELQAQRAPGLRALPGEGPDAVRAWGPG